MRSESETFEGGVIRVGEAGIRGGSRSERSVGCNRKAASDAPWRKVSRWLSIRCGKGERGKLPDEGGG